ncbi:MAG: tRNA (adenosine(37)-N6)-dimethylallyltransferase MiaA [Spongiibacteraceae bacterium]
MNPITAICLMGPTASGKTALALEIAKHYPCEIISVDSALVYRGMDIGTAKPTPVELAQVPHHLVDILDPAQTYSAANFRRDALRLIGEIHARGRIPLLVGGTMLYFRVLLEGIADMPSANSAVRDEIAREAERLGWPAIHAELARVDPVAASKIHPQHSQRIQRALEVYRLTGVPISQLQAEGTTQQPGADETESVRWIQLAVAPADRKVLHARIATRFDAMLEAGFIDEVAALKARGDLHTDLPSIRAVGYRQAWDYLDQRVSYAEMIERGVIATRQLAKRQLTWLRSWPDLCWFYTDADQRVTNCVVAGEERTEVAGLSLTAAALKYLGSISI